MSIPTIIESQPKCSPTFSGDKETTGIFNPRPIDSAISLSGIPSSPTALYRAPATAFSNASLYSTAASSRCAAGQRLVPSPTYAETPFWRATAIRGVMRPCLKGSWTCGKRITDTLTPFANMDSAASSDAPRGNTELGISGSSSVRGWPDALRPVPEVITKCRLDPASSAPMASMTFLSVSQVSTNFLKSWSKAQCITPSALAAPLRRLSRS